MKNFVGEPIKNLTEAVEETFYQVDERYSVFETHPGKYMVSRNESKIKLILNILVEYATRQPKRSNIKTESPDLIAARKIARWAEAEHEAGSAGDRFPASDVLEMGKYYERVINNLDARWEAAMDRLEWIEANIRKGSENG